MRHYSKVLYDYLRHCLRFIKRQFNFATVIWKFCRKTFAFQKCKRYITKRYASYDDFLTLTNNAYLQQKHLSLLTAEIFKSVDIMNPKFIKT